MKTIEEVIAIYLRLNVSQIVVDYDNHCYYSYDTDTNTFVYKPINDDPASPWLYHDHLNNVYDLLLMYGCDISFRPQDLS